MLKLYVNAAFNKIHTYYTTTPL